jgi:hypothetical protein
LFLFLGNDHHEPDEQADQLSAFLAHCAHLNIVVRPLSTGRSINVTGNLNFMWTSNLSQEKNQYQFRVEEKDVKVFAAGTSTAVL